MRDVENPKGEKMERKTDGNQRRGWGWRWESGIKFKRKRDERKMEAEGGFGEEQE